MSGGALVVLLRGVNVGGHKTFRPSVLVDRLKPLDVINIGAAGTFVVRQSATPARVRAAFADSLPFEAEIMICDGRDITRLVSRDVFADHPARPDIVPFVSVLAKAPRSAPSLPLSFPPTGEWLLRVLAREGRFVVGLYRRHTKAIRYLGTLDRVFGVPATTRNWNTITAIANVLGGSVAASSPKTR